MLNREEILGLIKKNNLVQGYINLETQLTPNGLDLTAANIFEFERAGRVDFSNKERDIPQGKEILPQKEKPEDKFGTSTTSFDKLRTSPERSRGTLSTDGERSRTIGWWHLKKGAYKIRTNETVNLPADLIALAFSRTSLLRAGAFTQHGVWDAGFQGRGEFVLVVENPQGLKLKENARVAQLIFLRINETKKGYAGIYKNL